MGRMHDALKKAEEERRKKREAQRAGVASEEAPTRPAPTPTPAPPAEFVEEPPAAPTVRKPVRTVPIELPSSEDVAESNRKSGIAAGLERASQALRQSPNGQLFGELLLTLHSPTDQRSEQIRAIRTNILSLDVVPHMLAVTSAVNDEGAGLTAANLAVCFAEDRSQKILLVDADLRSSRLRGFFDVPSESPGFTEILEGSLAPAEAVLETGIRNVFLVTAGRTTGNPGGLLSSRSLGTMFKAWCERFDRVIVVMPPVNEVSDAAIIGREVDGTLMVVKLGATPRRESEHAVETLSASGVEMIGCVVTNAGPVRENQGPRH